MNELSAPAVSKGVQQGELRINEIFYSIQGEAQSAGWPTVFIRLTGCPLRCQYCDTAYAFHQGQRLSLDDIEQTLKKYSVRHVTISGGEPLAQPASLTLMTRLCDLGYEVSLETSGALDISRVDRRVIKVVDVKTPASLEVHKNRLENYAQLQPTDQLKFVICDRADFDWACQFIVKHALDTCCTIWFSPSYEQLDATELADWIIQAQLNVRLQLQLHKLLWGDKPGV
jgi:7-carboxy-7-deazaguanine synthase